MNPPRTNLANGVVDRPHAGPSVACVEIGAKADQPVDHIYALLEDGEGQGGVAAILLTVLVEPFAPIVRVAVLETNRCLLHQIHVAKDHRVVERVATTASQHNG